jgi:hypothetical protein
MRVPTPKGFYVYVYFRPWDGSPCYVGKGQKSRWRSHLRQCHNKHLAAIIKKANGDLPVVIIRSGLTEEEAHSIEMAFIQAIGRVVDGGPLANLTIGGDGVAGRIMSAEEIERRRAILNSPEVKEKLIRSHLGKPSARKGIEVSAETRKKMSEAHPKVLSEKHKQGIADGMVRRWADESNCEAQRQIQLKRYADPDERLATGLAVKEALARPEVKEKNVARMVKFWSDPTNRETTSKKLQKTYSDPTLRQKHSDRMKLWWAERKASGHVTS